MNVKQKNWSTGYLWTSCFLSAVLLVASLHSSASADPCGLVPPIYVGNQVPIARTGLQKTYVFHKDGVETFVIRPGFTGDIDNFGMLIPFPNPPELRKVSDNVFDQIVNAIDPPEVLVDLTPRPMMAMARGAGGGAVGAEAPMAFATKERVVVHKQEAVGMYEVAVLSAGSADALKKWIDENGYQYPDGMDKVTNDYVDQGWCFVAVKTKVGNKSATDPKPGQRNVDAKLPQGSSFDGNVQAMGFRFPSEQLVVPMRLSAFNEGDLRNVVYILTDGPKKIRAIPEEYVVRQISGQDLYNNVTRPLPLRIIGGGEADIPEYRRAQITKDRDPVKKNGVARDLFAADLLAVSTGNLSHEHEEKEKELLRIGEYFGLRGGEIDKLNADALTELREQTTKNGLEMLKGMTLSVVDGDFPRDVIANDNLTFAQFEMPRGKNNELNYDAKEFGPGKKKRDGTLIIGSIDWQKIDRIQKVSSLHSRNASQSNLVLAENVDSIDAQETSKSSWLIPALLSGVAVILVTFTFPKRALIVLVVVGFGILVSTQAFATSDSPSQQTELEEQVAALKDWKTAEAAIEWLVDNAKSSDQGRESTIANLVILVATDGEIPQKGWAIAALGKIGGQDVDEQLLGIHATPNVDPLVKTWAAAARVANTKTMPGLIEKANLLREFPALGRPISQRGRENLGDSSAEQVIQVGTKIPSLRTALATRIFAFGSNELVQVMSTSTDQNTRRQAAGYLGAMANQGDKEDVAVSVIKRLEFVANAADVPWSGGALFVPGMQWPKAEARTLARTLVCWHAWCHKNGKPDEARQVHNNLSSLNLARAAGYELTRGRRAETNAETWIEVWSKAFGNDEAQAIRNAVGF